MGNYIRTAGSSNPFISAVTISQASASTVTNNLQDAYNRFWSAGIFWGADYTDNGDGTVAVGVGEGVLRVNAAGNSEVRAVRVTAHTGLTMTQDNVNYIYADYNGGAPIYSASTNLADFNCQDKCLVYTVYRCSTNNLLDIVDGRSMNEDFNTKHRRKLLNTVLFDYSRNGVQFSADTGLNVILTSGSTWYGLNKIPLNRFETRNDLFDSYHRDGSGGWTRVTGATMNNVLYDNSSGILASASTNGYTTRWFWQVINDQGGKLAMVYGRTNHKYVTDAQEEGMPDGLPPRLNDIAKYVGRAIVQRNNSDIVFLENALAESTTFPTASHDGLSNLQGGQTTVDGDEHYHFTAAEHSYLQDVIGGTVSANTNFTGTISSGGTELSQLFPTPAGDTAYVQYNNNGSFAAENTFRYLSSQDRLVIGTSSTPTDNGEFLYGSGNLTVTGSITAQTNVKINRRAIFNAFTGTLSSIGANNINCANGSIQVLTASASPMTLTFSNAEVGTYIFVIVNSGAVTLSLATSSGWYTPSGADINFTTTAGAVNIITAIYDGTRMMVTSTENYIHKT